MECQDYRLCRIAFTVAAFVQYRGHNQRTLLKINIIFYFIHSFPET